AGVWLFRLLNHQKSSIGCDRIGSERKRFVKGWRKFEQFLWFFEPGRAELQAGGHEEVSFLVGEKEFLAVRVPDRPLTALPRDGSLILKRGELSDVNFILKWILWVEKGDKAVVWRKDG